MTGRLVWLDVLLSTRQENQTQHKEGRKYLKKEREKHPVQKMNGYLKLIKRPANLYITVIITECIFF